MYRRYMGKSSGVMKHLDFIILDILALLISFTVAYWLKFHNMALFYAESWRGILVVTCLLDLAVLLMTAPFCGVLQRSGSMELIQSLKNAVSNFILCCIVMYVLKCGPTFSRTVMILLYLFYWITSFVFRMGWKKAICAQITAVDAAEKIFVIGSKANMPQLLRSISSEFLNQYQVGGICLTDGTPGEKVTTQIDLIGDRGEVKIKRLEFKNSVSLDGIAEYVLENHIHEIFVGVNPSLLPAEVYKTLADNGKQIHLDIRSLVGFIPGEQYISTVGTYKTVTIGNHTMSGQQMVYMAIKRGLDLAVSLVGMVILFPVLLIVKLCCLSSGDRYPVLYAQTRVGLNGEPFKLYKFRSMVNNADEVLESLLKDPAYEQEWKEKQKFEQDPRVTSLGNFLRKTSIDEMPQFINVLRGEMSLIGPRPLVLGELEQHNGLQMYNDVKPGITGWWGCNGRSNTTYEERLSLEYYYVEHCSFYLDLLCFVKTIAAIFKNDGAC